MGRQYGLVVVAFVIGIGVGGLAFGQRNASIGLPQPATAEAQTPGSPALELQMETPPAESSDTPPEESLATEAASDVLEVELGPISDAERLVAIERHWSRLSSEFDSLSRRVVDLERQLAERDDDVDGQQAAQTLPIDTPEDRQTALIFAGVDRRAAEDIVWRESELAMQRLNLRDRAAREGWLGSERFMDELSALDDQAVDLRAEVGDASYDRFLFETGQPNRVSVTSVITGSQGELAGMLPGDIIEEYAGERVFDFTDLRSATMAGTRDEAVPVIIRREGRFIETWLPRGPIGVSLQADSASPDWQ